MFLEVQVKANGKSEGNNSVKETKVTLMVLIVSSINLVGNVPNSFSPVVFTLNLLNTIDYNIYLIIGNFFLFFSHSLYFFIYYFFNNSFRQVFFNSDNKSN